MTEAEIRSDERRKIIKAFLVGIESMKRSDDPQAAFTLAMADILGLSFDDHHVMCELREGKACTCGESNRRGGDNHEPSEG